MSLEDKNRLLPIILERPSIREGLSDWVEYIRLKRQQEEESAKDEITVNDDFRPAENSGSFTYDGIEIQRRKDARAKTDGLANRGKGKVSYLEFRKNAMNPNR